MAEAGGNLSIMGWGVTLLTYAIASMAYAGLFTTEPWDTGGFGILSFLVFMIGIAFFIIGLSMQIFGGEEAPGRMPALDRFRNIFRRRGAPPAPRMPTAPTLTPGAPTPAAAQTLAPETPPAPEPGAPTPTAAQTLAPETPPAPEPGAPTPAAPRAGLPGPTPKARLGVPLVSLQQLRDWDSIITQNLFTGKDYPGKDPILHHHEGRIDEKINMLRNIRDVLREIEQRQGQFQHVFDWSKLFTEDPQTNYFQYFNRIVTDFERVNESTDLGELEKIHHQWRGHYNDTFNGRAMAIRKRIRDERTGRATTEEALKRLPPPKKKTAMNEAAQQTGAPRFGHPNIRYPLASHIHLDVDTLNHLLNLLESTRFKEKGKVLENIPKDYERKLEALYKACSSLVLSEFETVTPKGISWTIYKLKEIATYLANYYRMQELINQGQQPDADAKSSIGITREVYKKLTFRQINALVNRVIKMINKEKNAAGKKAPAGAI